MDAEKGFIFFVVIVLIGSFSIFYFTYTTKTNERLERMNSICEELTVSLNELNESEKVCVEYFCYYEAYTPPEGLEETQTMCVCECRLEDGKITKIQVLNPKTLY